MATLKAIPGGQGGAVKTTGVEPYGLTPEFERALIYLACCNRDVYGRVGHLLDPKALVDVNAQRLLKAAQAIAVDLGEGPTSLLTVVQRLKVWREEGKVTHENLQEVSEYLDAAEDVGLPDAKEVIKEVAAVLKQRERQKGAKKVLDTMAKGGDFKKLGEELAAVERIGENNATMGEMLHEDLLDQIVSSANLSRFPTGSMEMDAILGGGLPKGLTLFMGREKSGKSMVLSSVAADAIWRGSNVALATLELDTLDQMSRILANLLNCDINEVKRGSERVRRRFAQIKDFIGKITVKKFSPDTPVPEIVRWKESVEKTSGLKNDLLVVDYMDLVGASKGAMDENAYTAQKVVGNTFRDHALEHGYVTISATQGKRGSGNGTKPLDVDDASDSQNKIRVADLAIAMRMDQDRKEMIDWYIIAARNGNDRIGTGELPAMRARGRMFPVQRTAPWDSEDQGYTHRPAPDYDY